MNGAAALIDEATGALARLDAGALGELEVRAAGLWTLGVEAAAADEIAARLRVFASVLRETDRGLRVLARVQGRGNTWGR